MRGYVDSEKYIAYPIIFLCINNELRTYMKWFIQKKKKKSRRGRRLQYR